MNLKPLILVVLSMVSLSLFAQDTYYYYSGQRIPLTTDPTRVNVITLSSYSTQGGAAFMPAAVPTGIQVETVISGSIYNMSVLKVSESNVSLLYDYVNSTVNPNYNIVLSCFKNSDGDDLVLSDLIYVKLKNLSQVSTLQSIASSYHLNIVSQDDFLPLWYYVSITPQTPYKTVEMANILYETGVFAAVEPEFIFESGAESISWDGNVSEQWGLYNAENDSIDINASSAWNYATGKGIKVAVVDGGFEYTHEDIAPRLRTKITTNSKNGDHGTPVCGIIAAERNNGKHIASVAPDATLIPISYGSAKPNVAPDFGTEKNFDVNSLKIKMALENAYKAGADIVNCSWFNRIESPLIEDMLDILINDGRGGKGCIIVMSAGNKNKNELTYPSEYRLEIITVGAIQSDGLRYYENDSKGSCYGNALDVVAPGVNVLSAAPNNSTDYYTGTSFSAPHVSGIAALILELNPDLTAQQVSDIIEQSTIKVGLRVEEGEYETHSNRPNGTWNQYYGYGLVDALKAVQNTPRKQEDY